MRVRVAISGTIRDGLRILAVALAAAVIAPSPVVAAGSDSGQAARIDELLARMTLAEKLGQLDQRAGGRSKNLNSKIDPAELDRVRRGEVGSYLHVAGAEFLRELQRVAVEESRLKIPLLFAMDVVHGYRTIFPVPLAMASSWEPQALREAARIAAVEASASGLHWTFAPMVDIARDPRWGRIVEGAGEDPFLGSAMAVAQVQGYQGSSLRSGESLLATAKHFGAYGAAQGGRDYDTADISERTLNEVYLPPFYAAARAGSGSFMTAFNDIGGVPTTANRALVRGTLRDAWGYQGLVVSDWFAIAELLNHGVANDRSDAGRLALEASVDMDMTAGVYATDLRAALERKSVPMSRVDEAVRRVLGAKAALGLFENPYRGASAERERAVLLSPEHRAAAREIARKSIVLLRNENGLLPLSKSGSGTIAVIGALADDAMSALGSWRAQGQAADVKTLLQALRETAGARGRIVYEPGASTRSDDRSGIERAVAAAKSADTVLLVIGEDYDFSGEARSRSNLGLPGAQQALAEAVLATGKPVVVVLMNGRPLALEGAVASAPVLLETWFLGVESGPAIVDVLFGAAPGGKLPVTFPRAAGQAPFFYNHAPTGRPADPDLTKDTARYRDVPITPLFAFGHGLSYTTFEYSDLRIDAERIAADGAVTVSVTLRNSGKAPGEEVAQLYVRDPVASVARPVKQLRGFKRVALAPGERARLSFRLSAAQLALYGEDGRWHIEPGKIEVMIGSSSADIRASGAFEISSAAITTAPAAALPTPVTVSKL